MSELGPLPFSVSSPPLVSPLPALPPCFPQDQTESAAILKIKESMQEEAKRFEKDTPAEPPDYFMQ